MRALVPLFPLFTKREAQALAELAVRNGQIWSASACRTEYLPEFMRVLGRRVESATLAALKYQVDNDERYRREP
jgi:hypothetical protein